MCIAIFGRIEIRPQELSVQPSVVAKSGSRTRFDGWTWTCGPFLFMKLPINARWQGFPFHSSTCPIRGRARHTLFFFLLYKKVLLLYFFSFSSLPVFNQKNANPVVCVITKERKYFNILKKQLLSWNCVLLRIHLSYVDNFHYSNSIFKLKSNACFYGIQFFHILLFHFSFIII